MKIKKFMRHRIAAGILAAMTAIGSAFPAQVAAQGLAGIETGGMPGLDRETSNTEGGDGTERETGGVPGAEQETDKAFGNGPTAEEMPGTEQGAGNTPDVSGTESTTEESSDTETRVPGTLVPDLETEDVPPWGVGETDAEQWTDTETDTEPDIDTDTDTEPDIDTDTEPADKIVLTDTNGDTEISVFLKGGEIFPAGTCFRVLRIANMIGETEEKEARCSEAEEALLAEWSNVLSEKEIKNVQIFLPYYLLLADAQGEEMELPGEAEIRLTIRSENFYNAFLCAESLAGDFSDGEIFNARNSETDDRAELFHIAWHGKKNMFREISEKQIVLDEAKHSVTFIFKTREAGWISLLRTDTETGEQEEITEPESASELESGAEAESEAEPGAAAGEEAKSESEAEQKPESESESEPEAGIGLESLAAIQSLAALAALPPSGSLVTSSGSGFRLMSTSELDGSCRTACWYSGISSFVPFNAAGSAVKTMSGAGGNIYVFYPTNDVSAGKFGGIYQKVLFQEGIWYDLKMTVTAYTNKTYAGTSGAQVVSYPPIGFSQSKIAWYFKPTMGEYILKMEYFRHGDAQQVPVALNSRFQWWEIDNSQRFGIRTENGSIAKKFYQSAGSTVYYKSEKAKADENTYLFLTASEDLEANDPKGNVGFVLQNCSRYYVAVGYRDHIEDSSDYRVSKASIEKWNTSLKNGKPDEVTLGILVQTGLDVPNPPDPSYPKKYVSNDGASWAQTNTLPGTTAEYYYKIEQYIPWQTPNNYYEQMVIEDVLPAGADYVGPVTITCLESGQASSGSFQCVQKSDTLSITPSNLKDAALYGRTYAFVFKVRMNPEEIQPEQTQNTAVYTVQNSAALVYKHSGQNAVSMGSNKVTTQAAVQRKALPAPVKRLDRSESVQEKQLPDAGETIVFSIFQTVPYNEKAWQPVQMVLTDELEPCLETISAEVFCKEGGNYAAASQWKTSVSGQSVVISCDFKTSPPAPDDQILRFDITCRLKDGYDLSVYEQVVGNQRWYVVPNKARLKAVWEKGSPLSEEKETNTVTVKLLAGAVEAQLHLTKEIDAADIVWAHGNPAFTFCISGEDVLGKRHTYYRTVEFTPGSMQNAEKVSAAADLTVPAGWYTVSEEKTMRYRLQSIHSIENGILSGETVVFDVSKGQTGSAVFYNQKTTDEGESHSAFVKNEIKK